VYWSAAALCATAAAPAEFWAGDVAAWKTTAQANKTAMESNVRVRIIRRSRAQEQFE
jgi:hypothetical protein